MNKIFALLLASMLIVAALLVYTGGGDDTEATGGDTGGDTIVTGPVEATVSFNGSSISSIGNGVQISGNVVKVITAGTYAFTGTLIDGQIIVDADDSDIVTLVLNGVDMYCSDSAPIFVKNAEDVIIVLSENTDNYVRDGDSYVFEDDSTDEPDATIFSKDDLLITGDGTLTVYANFNNGIQSKDDLEIAGGTITVTAANDGIKGTDSIVVRNATISIDAEGGGMQSANAEDDGKGHVLIQSGSITIVCGEDGIQAETTLTINGGVIDITAGGGSEYSGDSMGLMAEDGIIIADGAIVIDSSDDAIYSNDRVEINGGIFSLSTTDDGVHADSTIEINAGNIEITSCYEGIEGANITINAGTIHVTARDDGINVTDGEGNDFDGDGPSSWGDNGLTIQGGYIYVDSTGDGFDMNGWILMTGGTVIINGPTSNANGALDFDESFTVSGGFIVAVGSLGMAQSPSMTSGLNSANLSFQSPLQAGTMVHIESEDGDNILTFVPTKTFQSVVICSQGLESGKSYLVYLGGTCSGTQTDGLYTGGSYADGTYVGRFTVSG